MSQFTIDAIPDQRGRTAVVTGANTGIGFETARALACRGARVILACRSAEKAAAAAEKIRAEPLAGSVECRELDLSDLESVARFAAGFAGEPRLDLLINNAGVMVPPFGRTAQGFELQLGTNHLGHFALAARLLPQLLLTPASRLVVVSSAVHHMGNIHFDDLNYDRRSYSAWQAYAQSKLANLLFALELDRRLGAANAETIVTAAHPGWTHTDLQRTAAVARFFGSALAMRPAGGALPTLCAATAPDACGGDYYGPGGFMELAGAPALARISPRARDAGVSARLWSESERLVGLRFPTLRSATAA